MKKGTKRIPLTQGKYAIVDVEDYERVMTLKWQARRCSGGRNWYAIHAYWDADLRKGGEMGLHKFVLEYGGKVDHVDHDGLNCSKENLRLSTSSQNAANTRKGVVRSTSSKYKGVSWHKHRSMWQANITVGKKRMYLGLFNRETAAAKTYDKFAVIYFGEFALLNFPIKTSGTHKAETPKGYKLAGSFLPSPYVRAD